MLLNVLSWFGRTCDVRILAGKSGDLLSDFAELGEFDCFKLERSFAYRVLQLSEAPVEQANSHPSFRAR